MGAASRQPCRKLCRTRKLLLLRWRPNDSPQGVPRRLHRPSWGRPPPGRRKCHPLMPHASTLPQVRRLFLKNLVVVARAVSGSLPIRSGKVLQENFPNYSPIKVRLALSHSVSPIRENGFSLPKVSTTGENWNLRRRKRPEFKRRRHKDQFVGDTSVAMRARRPQPTTECRR
jgi:hypothetical protein